MSNCTVVTFDRPVNSIPEFHKVSDKTPKFSDASMCASTDTVDEISLLKDLFFNLKTTSRTDWTHINTERRHDFKFWAHVTHILGFDVLKCVFNIGASYFDNYNLTRYHVKSVFGDELSCTPNYTMTLKNEVAFHLLSGMIQNRIPGSLRLIIRGNGYTFFENRINELLVADVIDHDALCHNMNAIIALFPYLVEFKSVKLSQCCFNFVTSRLWKYMWAYVARQLKGNDDKFDEKLFLTFLELATSFLYGARGPGLVKRLNSSTSTYLWNSLIPLFSWSMQKKILCKIVSFTADILLLSLSDGCHEFIPKDVFGALTHNVSRSIDNARAEGFGPFNGLSSNDFSAYYSNLCVEMLEMLHKVLTTNIKQLKRVSDLIYDLSTLGNSRLTIPYKCSNIFTSDPTMEDVIFPTKQFPRVLPCFNDDCPRVYHIDLPQIHVVNNDSVNFFYCKRCGIPSYCSERCCEEHWRYAHKEVCPYFMNFPTFSRYTPPSDMKILSTIDQQDLNCMESDSKTNWDVVF